MRSFLPALAMLLGLSGALSIPLWGQSVSTNSPAATPIPAAPLFPFVLPWDDGGASATNISTWLDTLSGARKFVTAKDGHLFLGDKRLRLLGVNFSSGACFPPHEDADKIAARLAKFGVGCVRLHDFDSKPPPLGLLQADQLTLDPTQLDKLDYFIFALKEKGLHVDLVLHDGRVYPGSPTGDNLPSADQGLDNFYPAMIEAQQRYAASLLGHVNPFTKAGYSHEPAIAFVEINPVSSLLHAWWTNQLDNLSDPYTTELQAQWNKWLQARYGSDEKLSAQWNAHEAPVGTEELLGLFNGYAAWQVEQNWPASMKAQPAPDSPNLPATWVHVTGVGLDPAHGSYVRYHQALDGTKAYEFSFQAKSDHPRTLAVRAQQMNEFSGIIASIPVSITTEWKKYTVTFVPTMSVGEARFGFTNLAGEVGDWYFADLSLKTAPSQGLPAGEKIGSVQILSKSLFYVRTHEAQVDWLTFLAETEKNYWTGMNRFLKDTAKTSSLVLGAQANLSPPLLQGDLDAVGASASWQSPRQPNPLKPDEWITRNASMVNDLNGGTLGSLAVLRMAGKPFLCTSYDAPFPNAYAAEGLPLLAAYSALQDWDVIFVASYSSDLDTLKGGKIGNFFDIAQNPVKMATLPATAALFVRGDVQSAPPRSINESTNQLVEQMTKSGPTMTPASLGVLPQEALRHALQLVTDGSGKPTGAIPQSVFPGINSDTLDLRWKTDAHQGIVTIDTNKSAGIIGFGNGAYSLSHIIIAPQPSASGWSVILVTVLDGDNFQTAKRVLITATGLATNTGTKWESGKNHSISKDWGTGPALVEGIGATITLPASGPAQAWALNEKGENGAEIPVQMVGGKAVIEISPASKTLWYKVDFAAKAP